MINLKIKKVFITILVLIFTAVNSAVLSGCKEEVIDLIVTSELEHISNVSVNYYENRSLAEENDVSKSKDFNEMIKRDDVAYINVGFQIDETAKGKGIDNYTLNFETTDNSGISIVSANTASTSNIDLTAVFSTHTKAKQCFVIFKVDDIRSMKNYASLSLSADGGEYVDFYTISILNYTKVQGGYSVKAKDKNSISGNVVIRSKVRGKDVVEIGDRAFWDCDYMTSITIPKSVTYIGNSAFNCDKLSTVYFLGLIDDWAEIEYNSSWSQPLYFAKDLVIDNRLITEANITTATKISKYAFYHYYNLKRVTIGDSVTSIGKWAFSWCVNLVSVKIGSGVTSIGEEAFHDTDIVSIVIPDSVTNIDYMAFAYCELRTVTIGKGVRKIGGYAFGGNKELKTVNYNGTKQKWEAIEKSDNWIDGSASEYVIHCTDGDIEINKG